VTEGGPHRLSCRGCGSRMANTKEGVFVAIPVQNFTSPIPLPDAYHSTAHIFYSERTISVKDSLPKYARWPPAMGMGSELIQED
jgi:hypothetical protein